MFSSPQTDRRNARTEPLVRLLYGLDSHNVANQHLTVSASASEAENDTRKE